jgi:dihydroorotate dehydrogenase (fumarate)
MPPRLTLDPPLLNAACPWASDLSYLRPLFASPSTGGITTRTSLVNGYPHSDAKNTFLFYDPSDSSRSTSHTPAAFPSDSAEGTNTGSLNCFGLSPHTLETYCGWITQLAAENPGSRKLVIVSVTGETPATNAAAVARVIALSRTVRLRLAVEINLSCPNVPNVPPPAYDPAQLAQFLAALPDSPIPLGLKTTPYTHPGQFGMLVDAVKASGKVSFITATNTLGACTLLDRQGRPILPSDGGFGGLAGPAIHPLALGNVVTLRKLLDEAGMQQVDIIGVGGVADAAGYKRMRAAGASAVAVATALGKQGVVVFDRIVQGEGRGAKL